MSRHFVAGPTTRSSVSTTAGPSGDAAGVSRFVPMSSGPSGVSQMVFFSPDASPAAAGAVASASAAPSPSPYASLNHHPLAPANVPGPDQHHYYSFSTISPGALANVPPGAQHPHAHPHAHAHPSLAQPQSAASYYSSAYATSYHPDDVSSYAAYAGLPSSLPTMHPIAHYDPGASPYELYRRDAYPSFAHPHPQHQHQHAGPPTSPAMMGQSAQYNANSGTQHTQQYLQPQPQPQPLPSSTYLSSSHSAWVHESWAPREGVPQQPEPIQTMHARVQDIPSSKLHSVSQTFVVMSPPQAPPTAGPPSAAHMDGSGMGRYMKYEAGPPEMQMQQAMDGSHLSFNLHTTTTTTTHNADHRAAAQGLAPGLLHPDAAEPHAWGGQKRSRSPAVPLATASHSSYNVYTAQTPLSVAVPDAPVRAIPVARPILQAARGPRMAAQINDAPQKRPGRKRRKREKEIPCSVCGSVLLGPTAIERHMLIHTGAKPHVCDTCGKQFRQRSTLTCHQRLHTGEMPYSCDTCSLHFRHRSTWRRHMTECPQTHLAGTAAPPPPFTQANS